MHQPLDQGIISVIKTDYKKRMLSNFIDAYDNIEKLQELASQAKKGRKGLAVGCPATILDAAVLLKHSWDNLPASTILGCWCHSKCLSHLPDRLSNEVRPTTFARNQLAVDEICQSLSRIQLISNYQSSSVVTSINKLGLVGLVSEAPEKEEENVENVVQRWIALEEDPEIVASDILLLNSEVENSIETEASLDFTQFDVIDMYEPSQFEYDEFNICDKLLK